ncbi:methylmalonyl Co-A mutase-associated GTPase MeaB [Aegicerativicinus sediminis]|uniref:methylmalonyl Co-A mutase-associated GTPase MeaB n=1 Tax=Aegicerativicinus sediminis TaxID=2893202 RepID=UPI001E5454D9|nr:methylmalonyl Co-A mutase-associated GTPase MeaB [Aegicerativicinus sediminis]
MSKKKRTSAIDEVEGIEDPQEINALLAKSLKAKRKTKSSVEQLTKQLFEGNITALSKAITLVESSNPKDKESAKLIVNRCLPKTGQSIRIGITGVPGVGKSTFIESYGNFLVDNGKKVAVLAVDPSSSISKGSILGDKTRMETLVKRDNVFVRPTAAGTALGGVARKTRETILLCEAAGFDYLIIETVGVGQSETMVHSMVDFFLLLKLSNAGDELQGIKRGIMEMADLIVINKADGDNLKRAKLAQTEFKRAMHLLPAKESNFITEVLLASAINNEGISEIDKVISDYVEHVKKSGFFQEKRFQQQLFWLKHTVEQHLYDKFYESPVIKEAFKQQKSLLKEGKITAFEAADYLLSLQNLS